MQCTGCVTNLELEKPSLGICLGIVGLSLQCEFDQVHDLGHALVRAQGSGQYELVFGVGWVGLVC